MSSSLLLTQEAFTAKLFNVFDYGAKGDGRTRDTAAINQAIEACSAAGGGRVIFPKAVFLTGAINLRSNVELHLSDEETVILFSTDPADYPLVFTRWESTGCYNYSPLIYALEAENVAITGTGTLDGQGRVWHAWERHARPAIERLRRLAEEGVPAEERRFGTPEDGLRPQMIQFIDCKNILLEGVFITGTPFWAVHPVYCENVTIRDVTIVTRGPNSDGIDPESCRNVLIERTYFSTGDDCIAIKSGRDKDGRLIGRPSENIVVKDCLMMNGHGGVSIGSEMSGGIRKVRISNCEMRGTNSAIRIKSQRGRGGVVEDVVVENIKAKANLCPVIELTLHYHDIPPEPFSERTPVLRDITFRNIEADGGSHAIVIEGLDERPVENLVFEDVLIRAAKGVEISHARGVRFSKTRIKADAGERFTLTDSDGISVDGRSMTKSKIKS